MHACVCMDNKVCVVMEDHISSSMCPYGCHLYINYLCDAFLSRHLGLCRALSWSPVSGGGSTNNKVYVFFISQSMSEEDVMLQTITVHCEDILTDIYIYTCKYVHTQKSF